MVDRLLKETGKTAPHKCSTLDIPLLGGEGWRAAGPRCKHHTSAGRGLAAAACSRHATPAQTDQTGSRPAPWHCQFVEHGTYTLPLCMRASPDWRACAHVVGRSPLVSCLV